jgi:pantoate--beta-alanine ligase
MQVIHHAEALRHALIGQDRSALVPTMGNLHDGHLALVHQAGQQGHPVIASVFVNPIQFVAGEDFDRYPRTLAADCDKLSQAGCDIVFAPSVEEMYPEPQHFQIQPPLADELCGAFRPGHFAGVCTVVMKLFGIVQPRYAIFGKKDYQQLFLLKGMVKQFNLPIRILEADTTRAPDGLALSSRNAYLTASERNEAPRLNKALRNIANSLCEGLRNFSTLEENARHQLETAGWRVDYISIRSQATLLPPTDGNDKLVVLGAAWLNTTRLIDNLEVTL